MGWFGRSRTPAPVRVELLDGRPDEPSEVLPLLRIAAEALILQDEAETVLAAVRRHEHLGWVAPRGGPLVSRFFALRDALPSRPPAPELAAITSTLDTVLLHHAMQVSTALEFLAVEGRSEQAHRQVETLGGLGAPGLALEDAYQQLKALA
jgi:hypothetical protein